MKEDQTFSRGKAAIVTLLLFFSINMAARAFDPGKILSDKGTPENVISSAPGYLGYSGMALFNNDSYILVHDTKIKPGEDHESRISLLVVDCRGMYRETPLQVNWESKLKRKSNDLEGICAIPGREHEFLTVESGGYRGDNGETQIYGHIFHIRFTKNHEGELCGRIKQAIRMPAELTGVEGIACVRINDESWLLILGECGSRTRQCSEVIIKPARLHWDTLQLMSPNNTAQKFYSRGFVEFISPDLAACSFSVAMRSCSDMYVDSNNRLWISAALDPGNAGPFRSVIYRAGRIEPGATKQPIRIDCRLKEAWFIDGLKIEALAAAPTCLAGKAVLSFASDDENYNSIWRPLFRNTR